MVQLYIYMHPLFFKCFSHLGYYRIPSRDPCALRQVLVYYFVFSHVYMLTPNSQLAPSPTFRFGDPTFVLYICDSAAVLCVRSFVSF